jgi:hypothetical protein
VDEGVHVKVFFESYSFEVGLFICIVGSIEAHVKHFVGYSSTNGLSIESLFAPCLDLVVVSIGHYCIPYPIKHKEDYFKVYLAKFFLTTTFPSEY